MQKRVEQNVKKAARLSRRINLVKQRFLKLLWREHALLHAVLGPEMIKPVVEVERIDRLPVENGRTTKLSSSSSLHAVVVTESPSTETYLKP